MKRNRVNVLSVVNSASNITTEIINGRPHIVVRGVTPIVDDIVMNGKLYTAAEIAKGYKTLERTPMPLGHPKVDGKHVSARDVQAVNEYHVGAWLQDVEHKDGKVSGDMYVDRRYAESTEKGQRLVNRLDDMAARKNVEPIHISTGLLYSGIAANGESKGKKYREIVTNMMFDHVANLLDEPGAGTPEEGVGIFVNSDGSEQELEVVNLAEADTPDPDLPQDPALKSLFNQLKAFFSANSNSAKEEANPMKELITNALKAKGIDVEGKSDAELMDAYNQMAADDAKAKAEAEEKARKEKEEADKKAKETATNSEQAPAWFKPFADKLTTIESGLAVNADKEKGEKRNAVKAKFGLDDLAVNALDGAALDGLYAQCQTTTGLNGSFRQVNSNQSLSEMPE
ncbi:MULTISPECIES: DUF2213 domain-containing protein [Pantoea]|jgi:uncharacterized protein (DUF433 family)|uniref:DUF2213 domain-containing protein n=1 Tax=Pantoea TaxID=53335 RepID=UPI000EA13EF4|nr:MULTISPECIES: DUF2213 domain-containing protein [Pantoea]MBZ6385527.1 DUF2213 domain-containing protein [Pantoea piersonii]MBZ6398929.1 DUF2213 domain-containing protein [Pantoea piersonii]MBZ6407573.1 DUF2213 domain-containing protein [Pantoea piersonii]MBZ6425476.1 DUF2213 domain-containing protein [Pantoea piersonii]NYB01001.1 DUF2213 domain-containing protein [Pantoea piersonii]